MFKIVSKQNDTELDTCRASCSPQSWTVALATLPGYFSALWSLSAWIPILVQGQSSSAHSSSYCWHTLITIPNTRTCTLELEIRQLTYTVTSKLKNHHQFINAVAQSNKVQKFVPKPKVKNQPTTHSTFLFDTQKSKIVNHYSSNNQSSISILLFQQYYWEAETEYNQRFQTPKNSTFINSAETHKIKENQRKEKQNNNFRIRKCIDKLQK